jgi:hypothetical protein
MGQAFRIAWYRYRATFARQLSGYLTVVLLIGLSGGIGMAALAGAGVEFDLLATPTPTQRRAFELLGVPVPKTLMQPKGVHYCGTKHHVRIRRSVHAGVSSV